MFNVTHRNNIVMFEFAKMFICASLFGALPHFSTVSWEGKTSARGLKKRKGDVHGLLRACEMGGNLSYQWVGTWVRQDLKEPWTDWKDGSGCAGVDVVLVQREICLQRHQAEPLWSLVCWIGPPSAETLELFLPRKRWGEEETNSHQLVLQQAQSACRTEGSERA